MPRKNPNKTHYNYSIKELDKFGNIENITFYMTHYEIMEKYNISCPTIYRHLKLEKPIKKLSNLKIERVRVPVYKKVANDVFSHNFYYCSSSDEDYQEYNQDHKEIEYIEDLPNGEKNIIYSHN